MQSYINIHKIKDTLRIGGICCLFLALFGSCSMSKYCKNKFPPKITYDTIKSEKILYKDTTVYIYVPADTIIEEKVLYKTKHDTIILSEYDSDTIKAEVPFASAESWVSKGVLKLLLTQKDSIFDFKMDSVIQEKQSIQKILEIQTQYIESNKWKSFKRGLIVGVISLLLLLLLIKKLIK
jgi:hypothetical protein